MTEKRLAKNTMYLTLASVGQKAIAFFYFALIAQVMGRENTGAYFLALAIVVIIMVLDDIGVTSVVIRETAKKTENARLWCRTVMGVKIVTIPVTILIAWFVPVLFGYDAELTTLVRLAIVVMTADTLSLSFYGILRGVQQLKYESLGIFIGQGLTAVFGSALLLSGSATLPLLIGALMLGSVWNMLFSAFIVARKLGLRSFLPTYQLGWGPIKMAFAFFLAAAFVKIYSYTDSLILNQVMGEEAVGLYAIAYKLTYAFQFLPLAFVAALYPTMSAQAEDIPALRSTFLNAAWYMMLLAAPIVFGIWSLAPEIIVAFYSDLYLGSILPLQVLIFVLLFIFLDFPVGSLLNATNRQATKTAIMGATMVINIAANILLIPRFGIVGASIAALISFVFLFTAGWFAIRRVIDVTMIDLLKKTWALIVAGAVMAAIVVFVKAYLHFTLAIFVGAFVYVAVGFLLGGLRKQHVVKMRSTLR